MGVAGMPSFANLLDDSQIADVVNDVRTHFGYDYKAPVTPADVKAVRP
jgi:mono/diheme cytochrome c family protein